MIETFIYLGLLVVVTVASITDLASQRVPNWLTLPTVVVAVVLHGLAGGWAGVAFSAAGLATGFGLLIVFYVVGGMGAGDVKLMAAVGACIGAKAVFSVFILTTLLGGVYAIGAWAVPAMAQRGFRDVARGATEGARAMLITRQVEAAVPQGTSHPKLCYAVCIAAATFAVVLWDAGVLTGSQAITA